MRSEAEVRAHTVMRAAEDDDFLARLLVDRCPALDADTGSRVPHDYRLHVHEEGCGSFASAVQRGPGGAASGMARAT